VKAPKNWGRFSEGRFKERNAKTIVKLLLKINQIIIWVKLLFLFMESREGKDCGLYQKGEEEYENYEIELQ
jgi:hypothetical protein